MNVGLILLIVLVVLAIFGAVALIRGRRGPYV